MQKIIVTENEAGQRLDHLLQKVFDKTSASFIFKMLRKKNITLNGKKAEGKEKTALNDEISLFFSDDSLANLSTRFAYLVGGTAPVTEKKSDFEKTALNRKPASSVKSGTTYGNGERKTLKASEIVYEDADVIIVNKPVGELSQKAAATDISVNERIVEYLKTEGIGVNDSFKPGVCNRLDMNTSGLIIAGKSLKGLQEMSAIIKSRDLKKYYLCVVSGEMRESQKIKAYLKKDEATNKMDISSIKKEGYEEIQAEYQPLAHATYGKNRCTFLRVRLITGKPHQIRAHLSSLGFVLLGDKKYGYDDTPFNLRLRYQLLHSYELQFPADTGRLTGVSGKIIQTAPPKRFREIVELIFGEVEY